MLDAGNVLPAVTLDEFFRGNTDAQSIGVNLPAAKHTGLDGFRRVLKGIRARPEVQDVFLELTEIPDPDEPEDEDIWPTACVAFIVTSAALGQVRDWVADLHPRDISKGWNVKRGVRTPLAKKDLKAGMRPVRVWLL
jgi:hypothetical protein